MYSGLRPKFNTLKYNPRSSDPVNPVEGEVQYADGTARPEGLWVYKNSVWTPVGSGSGSALNYILDDSANFEGSIGNWIVYENTAQTTPVDGSGGTPDCTFVRNTSSPLNGTADGLLSKPASNEQGEGISCDFSIDNAYKNRPLKIKFNYSASANFVYGSVDGSTPSDVQVFLLDTTLTQFQQVFPNTLDGSGQFIGQFQASDSLDYRLILHIRSTNALAYTLQVDNFEVSPVDEAFIQSDSDWVAYTPTNTQGFGTPSVMDAKYRKQGPDLLLEVTFTAGNHSGSEAQFALPAGLTTASNYPSTQIVGTHVSSTSVYGFSVLAEASKSYLTFGSGIGAGGVAKRTGSQITTSTNGGIISFYAKVRIQGWTSGYATPGVSAQNVPVTFKAFKSGGSISANTAIPTWTTVVDDSVAGFNSSTGQYTIKQPGDYDVDFTLFVTSANTGVLYILVNGSVVQFGSSDSSSATKSFSAFLPNLNVGDIITVYSNSAATVGTSSVGTSLSIKKRNDPSAFLTIPKSITYTARISSAGVVSDETSSFGDSNWITGNAGISGTSVYTLTLNTAVVRQGVSINANVTVLDAGATAAIRMAQLTSVTSTSIAYVTQSQSGSTTALTTYGAIITVTVSNP